jgi:hypothetical protein
MSRHSEWFKNLSMADKRTCIPPGCQGDNGDNCEKYFESLTVADQEGIRNKWQERNKATPVPLAQPQPASVTTPAIVQPVKVAPAPIPEEPKAPVNVLRETEAIAAELMQVTTSAPVPIPTPEPQAPAQEPPTEEETTEAPADIPDFGSFSVKQLRGYIQDHNLDVRTTARKKEVIIKDILAALGK